MIFLKKYYFVYSLVPSYIVGESFPQMDSAECFLLTWRKVSTDGLTSAIYIAEQFSAGGLIRLSLRGNETVTGRTT